MRLSAKVWCAFLVVYLIGVFVLAFVLIPNGLLGEGSSTRIADYIFFLESSEEDAEADPTTKTYVHHYLFLLILTVTFFLTTVFILSRYMLMRVEFRSARRQFRSTQEDMQATRAKQEKQAAEMAATRMQQQEEENDRKLKEKNNEVLKLRQEREIIIEELRELRAYRDDAETRLAQLPATTQGRSTTAFLNDLSSGGRRESSGGLIVAPSGALTGSASARRTSVLARENERMAASRAFRLEEHDMQQSMLKEQLEELVSELELEKIKSDALEEEVNYLKEVNEKLEKQLEEASPESGGFFGLFGPASPKVKRKDTMPDEEEDTEEVLDLRNELEQVLAREKLAQERIEALEELLQELQQKQGNAEQSSNGSDDDSDESHGLVWEENAAAAEVDQCLQALDVIKARCKTRAQRATTVRHVALTLTSAMQALKSKAATVQPEILSEWSECAASTDDWANMMSPKGNAIPSLGPSASVTPVTKVNSSEVPTPRSERDVEIKLPSNFAAKRRASINRADGETLAMSISAMEDDEHGNGAKVSPRKHEKKKNNPFFAGVHLPPVPVADPSPRQSQSHQVSGVKADALAAASASAAVGGRGRVRLGTKRA